MKKRAGVELAACVDAVAVGVAAAEEALSSVQGGGLIGKIGGAVGDAIDGILG